jgi:hypothetical protein
MQDGQEPNTHRLRSADGKSVVRVERPLLISTTCVGPYQSRPSSPALGPGRGALHPGGQFRLHVENADADATGRVERASDRGGFR